VIAINLDYIFSLLSHFSHHFLAPNSLICAEETTHSPCAPVWHFALTKAQSESLEAIQKRAIHITHNLTCGIPYSSMLYRVNLNSLASRREDLSRDFFHNILDPASCFHSLLPPPRSTAITSRLRSSQTFPKVHTRTQRYCSFIQYGLHHYQ